MQGVQLQAAGLLMPGIGRLCSHISHALPCLLLSLHLAPSQIDMLRPGLFGSLDDFGVRYCDGKAPLDAHNATAPSRLDLRCGRLLVLLHPACVYVVSACLICNGCCRGGGRALIARMLQKSQRCCSAGWSLLNCFPAVLPCTRGSSNLDELHGRLEHALMIRRLKRDVSCWCGETAQSH